MSAYANVDEWLHILKKSGKVTKNTPITVTANAGFRSILKSGNGVALLAGGSRPLMKMLAQRQSTKVVSAMAPVPQLNPYRGMILWSINGNTTPPNAPPVAAIPVA